MLNHNCISNQKIYSLLNVLILATFLTVCILYSGKKHLDLDEIITYINFSRPVDELLWQTQDYSTPLYSLILKTFITQKVPTERLLRLPAAIFGFMSLVVFLKIIYSYFGNRSSLVAMMLLCITPFFYSYSITARPYTLYILSFSLMLYYSAGLLGAFDKKDLYKYAISAIMISYSSYIGIYIYAFFVVFLWIFAVKRDRVAVYVRVNLVILLLISPMIVMASRYVGEGLPALYGNWISRPRIGDFLFAARFKELFLDERLSFVFYAALVVTIGLCAECVIFSKKTPDVLSEYYAKSKHLLYLSLFSIFVIYYFLNMISIFFPIYTDRYGFPLLICVYICFIFIMQAVPYWSRILIIAMILMLTMDLNTRMAFHSEMLFEAKNRLVELNDAGYSTYLVKWSHGKGWISPEWTGLVYYKYNVKDIQFLVLDYGKSNDAAKVLNRDDLQENKLAILVFGGMDKFIKQFLDATGSGYRVERIGSYSVFTVDKLQNQPATKQDNDHVLPHPPEPDTRPTRAVAGATCLPQQNTKPPGVARRLLGPESALGPPVYLRPRLC